VVPTLGRPAFVEPGGALNIIAQVGEADGPTTFALLERGFPPHRHELTAPEDARERLRTGQPVRLDVPANVPEQTYDLAVECGAVQLVGRHCVAVGKVGPRVRLVHLSNMNVGELGAPDFDWRLVEEVNLVSPTLLVVTGDLLDATHEGPERGWERAVEFLSRFDAPTLVACGDHDDLTLYSRFLAPSPVGSVSVGGLRGVVLFDSPSHPIAEDTDQAAWLERTLAVPGDERTTFIVSHDEAPNLLDVWERRGVLAAMVKASRLGLWFAGGHHDWDGVEYARLVGAAAPLLYLRTQQSSPATRDGAEGVSHYRVVDVMEGRAWLPGRAVRPDGPVASIAAGRLHVFLHDANDGTQDRVAFTAINNHPFRLDGLNVRIVLRRGDDAAPWCLGAALAQVADHGAYRVCRVRFDLPDKGALRAVVGCGPKPAMPDVEVAIDTPSTLRLRREVTEEGLAYLTASDAFALVNLRNRGTEPATVTPLIRLDGESLGYTVLEEPGPAAIAYRLRLGAGQVVTLQADLSAIRVGVGRQDLQVYLRGGPAWRAVCQPVDVVVQSR